jgi:hypothetical protein
MTEILTESFCERCGTRYTFESAAPRGARLKGIKTMSRGLRNFVMSDDTSMDEAMAAARNETDREQTAQQLDAFHKTFNFCMSCRQYTCSNCWNEPEGRCLSCAPNLGTDILQAPFPNLGAGGAMTLTDAEAVGLKDRNGHDESTALEPMAWPTSDLMQEAERAADIPPLAADVAPLAADEPEEIDFAARLEALSRPKSFADAPAVDAAAAAEPPVVDVAPVVESPVVEAPTEPGPLVAAAPEPAPEPVEPPSEEEIAAIVAELARSDDAASAAPQPGDDRAAAAAANTSELFRKFRPGQNLDDEIEAYERAQAAAEAAIVADAAASPTALEPVVAPEPETVVAGAPEPGPIAAVPEPEPEPEAAAEPEPSAPWPVAAEPPAGEPRIDVVPQPTWQIVAPEAPTADGLPAPTVPPAGVPADAIAASAEPQWPAQPEWPAPQASAGLPYLGRPAAATGGIEALWAASAQELADLEAAQGAKVASGVQPCVSCGLSLSANARFCRRCGTRQG